MILVKFMGRFKNTCADHSEQPPQGRDRQGMADNRRSFNPTIRAMSSTLSTADVRQMASQGVVVLSPHFDDACFSMGGLLTSMGAGHLINVFSRSVYAPGCGALGLTESQVHEIRQAEDGAFADRVGLTRTELGGAEPDFWGRRPNDLSGVEQDILAMQAPLMDALKSHVVVGKRPFLFVPMATGHHVNHHAVYEMVRQHASALRASFRLAFYEDLPYAHVPSTRYQAIGRFKASFPGFERHAFSMRWSDKKSLIALYASQLRRAPHPLKFRPAVCWPLGMHEAVWLTPDDLEPRAQP
jgi:LmbE family N-acetylglucosaminyl deacetylase